MTRLLLTALLAALAFAAAPGLAQEEPNAALEPAEPALVVEGRERRAVLDAAVEEIDARLDKLEGTSGEARLILLGQVARLEMRILSLYDEFIENVVAREEAGIDASSDRATIKRELPRIQKYLERVIHDTERELLAFAARREELAPNELAAFELELADYNERLDSYYELLLEHAKRFDRVGLDGSGARAFLASQAGERADRLERRVGLVLKEIAGLNQRIKEGDDDSATRAQLRAAESRRDWTTSSLASVAESALLFVVRPWCRAGDYWEVYWDVTREVRRRLEAAGIALPRPAHDVRITGGGG